MTTRWCHANKSKERETDRQKHRKGQVRDNIFVRVSFIQKETKLFPGRFCQKRPEMTKVRHHYRMTSFGTFQ